MTFAVWTVLFIFAFIGFAAILAVLIYYITK